MKVFKINTVLLLLLAHQESTRNCSLRSPTRHETRRHGRQSRYVLTVDDDGKKNSATVVVNSRQQSTRKDRYNVATPLNNNQ